MRKAALCWIVGTMLWAQLSSARADRLQDRFDLVWESLWHQGGVPMEIVRWPGEIRVRIEGRNLSTHQDRIMQSLELVAGIAGRKLVRLEGDADDSASANLHVQIVRPRELPGNQACYVSMDEVVQGEIRKATLRMREDEVYQCVLHEAMHAMGVMGHPSGDTVLSYFYQRVDALTEMDHLLLKTWYSAAMRNAMLPFDALAVLTQAVVDVDKGDPLVAQQRRTAFLSQTLGSMEDFVSGEGDIPAILKRSGTASAGGMEHGRKLMGLLVAQAYLSGRVVSPDESRAVYWLAYGADQNFGLSQFLLGMLLAEGYEKRAASLIDAFIWLSLAVDNGVPQGLPSRDKVALMLDATQRKMADERIDALKARFKAAAQ